MTALVGPGHSGRVSRLASIDVYRGAVMFLMLAQALELCAVSNNLPESRIWGLLCYHQSHVEWVGWSIHDLIFPSFAFLVGVALPFSIEARRATGQQNRALIRHAAARSVILILLGIAIASAHPRTLTFAFDDVLPQVGFGYVPLVLIAMRGPRVAWIALAVLLAGHWLAFASFPLPDPEFSYGAVGVTPTWLDQYGMSGFAAHWQKNSNVGWFVDTWFLNLFPRHEEFRYHPGGYVTLSFVPLLATMILGLVAGRMLHRREGLRPTAMRLVAIGSTLIVAGLLLSYFNVSPLVKRLWTPSWTLWSAGCCFVVLATVHLVVERSVFMKLLFPFQVVGLNSITAYCLANFHSAFAFHALSRLVGAAPFRVFGAAYESTLR